MNARPLWLSQPKEPLSPPSNPEGCLAAGLPIDLRIFLEDDHGSGICRFDSVKLTLSTNVHFTSRWCADCSRKRPKVSKPNHISPPALPLQSTITYSTSISQLRREDAPRRLVLFRHGTTKTSHSYSRDQSGARSRHDK